MTLTDLQEWPSAQRETGTSSAAFEEPSATASPGLSGAGSATVEPPPPRLRVRVRRKPVWLDYVFQRLHDLAERLSHPLHEDALLCDPIALERSLAELQSVLTDTTPTPSVVPTADGGVQFVWHKAGWDIEVEVLADETLVWGRNREKGKGWEGSLSDVRHYLVRALEDIESAP